MGQRDIRYALIKPLLRDGEIQTFTDIFKFIPKTVVALDMGKKVERFTEKMNKIEDLTVGELLVLSNRCNITLGQMLQLVENEYERRIRNLKQDGSA